VGGKQTLTAGEHISQLVETLIGRFFFLKKKNLNNGVIIIVLISLLFHCSFGGGGRATLLFRGFWVVKDWRNR